MSIKAMAEYLGVAYDTVSNVIAGVKVSRVLSDERQAWILDQHRRRAVTFGIGEMARMLRVSHGTVASAAYPERRFAQKLTRVLGPRSRQQEVRA